MQRQAHGCQDLLSPYKNVDPVCLIFYRNHLCVFCIVVHLSRYKISFANYIHVQWNLVTCTPIEHEGQAIVSIFNRVLSLSRPSEKKADTCFIDMRTTAIILDLNYNLLPFKYWSWNVTMESATLL